MARYPLAPGVEQRFIARGPGVEQLWEIAGPVPAGTDLEIATDIRTALRGTADDRGVRFFDGHGGYAASYGAALVTDGAGRRISINPKLVRRGPVGQGLNHYQVLMVIPSVWLATAKFPILVDPLIGTEVQVGVAPGQLERNPAAIFGTTEYLAVWEKTQTDQDIVAARVTTTGVVQAPQIVVRSAVGAETDPAVAFNGTTEFFVVWTEASDIKGATVSTAGVVGTPVSITADAAVTADSLPSIAFDGTSYLVTWVAAGDIHGVLINAITLVVGAPFVISATAALETDPQVVYAATSATYLVAWRTANGVFATRVSTAGVVDLTPMTVMDGTVSGWSVGSVALATNATDGLVTWTDDRALVGSFDVFAARIQAATPSVLDTAGITVSAVAGSEAQVTASFGSGNYFVAWSHPLWPSSPDIFGARVSPAGVVLEPAGIEVSAAAGAQTGPTAAFDGTQFLVTWSDSRDTGFSDVFGQRVPGTFPTPPSGVLAADTPADNGGSVSLSWVPSTSPSVTFQHIYRETTANGPFVNLITTLAGNAATGYVDNAGGLGLTNGTTYHYIVRAFDGTYESADSLTSSAIPADNVVPAAPTLVTAVDTPADTGGSITLNWTPSVSADVVTQRIYRSTTTGVYGVPLATITGNLTGTYADATAVTGTAYFYIIRAFDGTQESVNSAEVTATAINNVPAAPTLVTAIDTPADNGGSITLNWTVSVSAGVTQQRIYRGTATTGPYTLLTTIAGNVTATYIDATATKGTTYYYVVRAWDGVQ
ncbi:MAG: hypothetical protein OEW11_03395, partial [Nitrospirota bacterium]|nr:hypothetical protein [Nitrospirota bacterium]